MDDIAPLADNRSRRDVEADLVVQRKRHVLDSCVGDQRAPVVLTKHDLVAYGWRSHHVGVAASQVQVLHACVCCGVPRIRHVDWDKCEHYTVGARLCAGNNVVHIDVYGVRLHDHPQRGCHPFRQCQQALVAAPVTSVRVAVGGVAIDHQDLASIRPEPHTWDARAVVAAVGVGGGEVDDIAPPIDKRSRRDVEADLIVQRNRHVLDSRACDQRAPVVLTKPDLIADRRRRWRSHYSSVGASQVQVLHASVCCDVPRIRHVDWDKCIYYTVGARL